MKWNWTNTTRALTLLGITMVLTAPAALAQTPEGTVITNTAVVNYQDANLRAYAPDTAQVSITVGFKAGLSTIAAAASVTPASPSTNDTITFTINNIGNGVDTVQASQSISVAGVMSNIRYRLNGGTVYTSLGDLNTALASLQLVGITGSAEVKVIFDVPGGQGGNSTLFSLTATSVRDGAIQSTGATTVAPPAAYTVAVTPDSALPRAERLPSSTPYSFTFYVKNTGNIADDYNLAATNSGSTITVTSVSVSSPVNIAAGDSVAVIVGYTIAEVAVGSTDRLTLTATSVTQPATDDGFLDMIVVRPAVAIAKAVFAPDSLTALAGTVKPGDVIWYRVTVTNTGDRDASSVVVTDSLPAELTFGLLAPDTGTDWGLSYSGGSGGTVTASLSIALAPSATRHFWIQAVVN